MTRACLDEIKASGADISKIDTRQNAMDVGAVRHEVPPHVIPGLARRITVHARGAAG